MQSRSRADDVPGCFTSILRAVFCCNCTPMRKVCARCLGLQKNEMNTQHAQALLRAPMRGDYPPGEEGRNTFFVHLREYEAGQENDIRDPEDPQFSHFYGIWRNSDKFSSKSVQNSMNIVKNIKIFDEILEIAKTFRRTFAKILNLERCEGMIFL